MGLNEPQREAVLHTDGPMLILAGPGSGKTRVVTRRAAYLAQNVTSPWNILAITFTNKAAIELRERIEALHVDSGITACTFHTFCARILRTYADRTGVSPHFTIFDRDDRRKLIKKAVEACDLSPTNYPPASVEQVISQAKNNMQTAEMFDEVAFDWRSRTHATIYASYEKLLQKMDGLDFDDLLMKLAMALQKDEQLRDKLEERYKYVLIDEYQDTNTSQYLIAKYLTLKNKNLCATGDPDQSIYGWRGANIENILSFENDYPSAKIIRLEQNYRSTKRILQAADQLIAGNLQRKQKSLWTENQDGTSVRVIECESGEEEAGWIVKDIQERIQLGASPGEIAVLYRINALSRVLEEAFIRHGINYQIARGVEFYNRREIKDVIAYLRVLINPADEISLLRIINSPPRGIGQTTIDRLLGMAKTKNIPLIEIINNKDEVTSVGRSASKVLDFAKLIESMKPLLEKPTPDALKQVMSLSGLRALYKSNHDIAESASANLDELISATTLFQEQFPDSTITDWLEYASLVSDVDSIQTGDGPVTLMTLHAAKGLEFDTVYILGVEKDILPFSRGFDDSADLEEERRLCFVGMTRARKRLTLSRARWRMLRGITERTTRSSFLDELPHAEIEWTSVESSQSGRSSNSNAATGNRLPEDIEEWSMGTLVRHPLHGIGQVMSMTRGAKRTHVDVQFKDGTRKTWVLEFADLERVDFDEVG